jgi:hypothetical protein
VEKRMAYIVHDSYGCESGCCGHRLILEDANRHVIESDWTFDHFYGDEMSKEEWCTSKLKARWPDCEVNMEECEAESD